ncbi:hypothetical protein [Streptomyces hokutonensis]|uniref:Uncharacterized protein n=1 Tax=Streptomyces hokutonensis TaxID=1306990 RepID=A0ABW6M915_9ACTN
MTISSTRHERPLARIRTDVVVLLADIDHHGGGQARLDGQPLTDQERALVAFATLGELRAAADHTGRLLGEERKQIAALDRIHELVGPYCARLPAGSTFGDVMPLMTDAERAELDALVRTLPVDGTVIVPRTA